MDNILHWLKLNKYSFFPIDENKQPNYTLLTDYNRKWGALRYQIPTSKDIRLWENSPSMALICNNHIVVDIDNMEYWKVFKKEYKNINTPIVKTRKGIHIYFKAPIMSTTPLFYNNKNIGDLKCYNSYTLIPWKNNGYKWINHIFEYPLINLDINKFSSIFQFRRKRKKIQNEYKKLEKLTEDEVSNILLQLNPIFNNYEYWYKIGIILKSEGYSSELFHKFSKRFENYNAHSVDTFWRNFPTHSSLNMGTLIYYSKG